MKISGIYKIQSIIKPERFYIGSAVSFRDRWSSHISRLRKNKHHSPRLQAHFNKYGIEDLVFIIVEPCFPEFLETREDYYIKTLKPLFNARQSAKSNRGHKWSEESKLKMIGNKNGAKKRSDETRKRMSDAAMGNKNSVGAKRTEAHKEKLRVVKTGNSFGIGNKSRIGQKRSEEELMKARKPLSEETKQKMKGRVPWNKGKTGVYSEETLNKMRGDNNGARKKKLLKSA